MGKTVTIMVVLSLSLAGCGSLRESRANPFNWFGGGQSEPVSAEAPPEVIERRPLVREVLSMRLDPVPEGAILRAVGLPPTQGWWDAELIEVKGEDPSVLIYEFRLIPPLSATRTGTQPSREVVVGRALSTKKLGGVRRVIVRAQANQRGVQR